jgi:hypothetical protein
MDLRALLGPSSRKAVFEPHEELSSTLSLFL